MPHLPGSAEAQRIAGAYGARIGPAGPTSHQVSHLQGEPACHRIPLRLLATGPRNSRRPTPQPLGRKQGLAVILLYSPFNPQILQLNGTAFLFLLYLWRWEESDLSSGLSLERAQEELERDEQMPQALHCHAEPQGSVTEAGTGPGSPTRSAAWCCHLGE